MLFPAPSKEVIMQYIYTALFTPIEDGSGYYAKVPDLPGCITTGNSLSDAINQITDAMNAWLVVAEDECETIESRKNMSQQGLADAPGISKSAINMYERGEHQPNFEILESIAAHFDGDEYTEEDLNKMKEFAAFVKSSRK